MQQIQELRVVSLGIDFFARLSADSFATIGRSTWAVADPEGFRGSFNPSTPSPLNIL